MSRRLARACGAVAATAGLVALTAGCGHPLIPASALRPAPSPSASASPSAAVAGPVLGVDLYSVSDYPAAEVFSDGTRDLAYIAHTLGAQSVGIAWNLHSPGAGSDTVSRAGALSPANVATLTELAHADHLSVEYRPLVKIGRSGRWEGWLDPASQAAWFNSYYQAELPYLQDAQRLGVREFVVATEMRGLNASPLWPAFLARVARVYHGIVSYTAWEGDYFPPTQRHLLPAALLGVDAYPDLALPDTASTAQLTAAWERYFAQVPAAILRRTAIDEIGIPAIAGAYRQPANWDGLRGAVDEPVQARWFTAACATVAHFHLRAIYFWNANLTDNPADPPYPSPTTFEGKTGATAIHDCRATFHTG